MVILSDIITKKCEMCTYFIIKQKGEGGMKKSLRALIVLVLSFVMAFSSAILVSAGEPDELVLSIYRTADNIVMLNWEGGETVRKPLCQI